MQAVGHGDPEGKAGTADHQTVRGSVEAGERKPCWG